jgi:Tfp pilus assembly pilus retraction ATPase PilT
VDVFPAGQQQQIRVQLGSTLVAVVHQELLPKIGGGRVAAFEVLVATPAVKNLIRENKVGQLRNVMVTSADVGMCTLEAALGWLVRAGLVTEEDALARSTFPKEVMSHSAPYIPSPTGPPGPPPAPGVPQQATEVTGVGATASFRTDRPA